MSAAPFVSVVTPVYNAADHLAACIESVLAQTYIHWDYTIVNNCSTDESLAIAEKYAARDSRIRVVNNDRFLRIIENHNHTIRHISPGAKYCKFVFADDWLFPNCLEELVRVAEAHASVGLVGGFTMDGRSVLLPGPEYPASCVDGREVCCAKLLGGPYVFGTMTSLLLRCDLIRKRAAFFNVQNLHADHEACIDVLQDSDFGFVHQVVAFSRPSERSTSTFAKEFNSILLGELVIFLKYGPVFLNQEQFNSRYKSVRGEYYRMLARSILRVRPRQFWEYHRNTLAAFGSQIEWRPLALSFVGELVGRLCHPRESLTEIRRLWFRAYNLRSGWTGMQHPP
jgi:glycosyltransferase involved in cell wall biosynthesis